MILSSSMKKKMLKIVLLCICFSYLRCEENPARSSSELGTSWKTSKSNIINDNVIFLIQSELKLPNIATTSPCVSRPNINHGIEKIYQS